MYVHVNAATSVDGKLSTRRRERLAISGPADFARVDRLRAEADAVMVGVGTVLADDPRLGLDADTAGADAVDADATGGDDAPTAPARVVADSRARTPTDARVLDEAAPTYVFTSEAADAGDVEQLEDAGAKVLTAGAERVALPDALDALESRGVERLLVEGGGELVFSLFARGLVDELTLYVGSLVIGGRDAPTLADGEGFLESFPELTLTDVERVDDGVLLSYEV